MTSSIVLVCLAGLIALAAASVDHDGWDFYGGRRVRPKHGLNLATADRAPRNGDGRIRFDAARPHNEPELVVTNDEAPPAQSFGPALRGSSDRVKATEELLLLPDALDFDSTKNSDPFWGRLYINGFPSSVQYFQAEFGRPPPYTAVKFVLASPLNMCSEETGLPILDNEHGVSEDTVVVTLRGGCTFSEKAFVAHGAGALGILFVNNEEGLFHASGPASLDLALSAAMITHHDGHHLINALRSTESSNSTLSGRYVPITCNDSCSPIHENDARFEASLIYDGRLSVNDGSSFEYVQGEFGAWIDPFAEWSTLLPTVIGGDAHCCEREGFAGNEVANATAVLCLRGECDFVTKAENAAAIGARMAIVATNNNTLTRMGSDPPIRGRQVDATAIMVGNEAYEHMASHFFSQLDAGSTSTIRLVHHGQVCTEKE